MTGGVVISRSSPTIFVDSGDHFRRQRRRRKSAMVDERIISYPWMSWQQQRALHRETCGCPSKGIQFFPGCIPHVDESFVSYPV